MSEEWGSIIAVAVAGILALSAGLGVMSQVRESRIKAAEVVNMRILYWTESEEGKLEVVWASLYNCSQSQSADGVVVASCYGHSRSSRCLFDNVGIVK